jgi:hypothetical protein
VRGEPALRFSFDGPSAWTEVPAGDPLSVAPSGKPNLIGRPNIAAIALIHEVRTATARYPRFWRDWG